MQIFRRHQLEKCQNLSLYIEAVEEGFVKYSQKQACVPPAGHIMLQNPPGDVHIKSGYLPGEDYYAIKIAAHFPHNSIQGIPTLDGLILLFSQKTGTPIAALLDEGYLTQLRTAIAGLICAKYLAPRDLKAIGIIGAGTQARMQLQLLASLFSNREVWIWAPRQEELKRYQQDPLLQEFNIHLARSVDEVAEHCRYIVTTTPSTHPLLFAHQIHPGTHITAVGADRIGKQELDPYIFQKTDLAIVDSREQCFAYGETKHALSLGLISPEKIWELGEVVGEIAPKRTSDQQITIADLTGLGVQDLQIAVAVFKELQKMDKNQ